MMHYLLASVTGRSALVLCTVTVGLPYLLRGGTVAPGLRVRQELKAPYLRRLSPHFWLGYGIVALTMTHVVAVMGSMGTAKAAGIWSATVALLLLLFEVTTGLTLREQSLRTRRTTRRVHFWTMVAFGGALGLHMWWNG
jgi:hypothetical protein